MNEKPTLDNLIAWRDEAIKELEVAKEELINIQHKLKASEERLELIERLLELERYSKPTISSQSENRHLDLLKECEIILREAGKSLHIKEIHSKLLEKGVVIPGKGNQANVITRFQRSNGKIIRTGRGAYGLPGFGEQEVKPRKKSYK